MFTIGSRMNTELYTSIHQVEFLAIVEVYWSDRQQFKKAPKWSQQNKVIVLKWPCSHMTSGLLNMGGNTTNGSPMSMGTSYELWGQVQMELDRMPKAVCRSLIESIAMELVNHNSF